MGVYIDMEMPKETTLISIGPGGTVEIHRNDDLTWVPLKEKAVPVPPHGRLGDLDKLNEEVHLLIKEKMFSRDDAGDLLETIADAPTIIPSSEEGEA